MNRRTFFLTVLLLGGMGMVQTTTADSMGKPVYDNPGAVQPLGKGQGVPGGELTTLEGKKTGLKTLISQKPSIDGSPWTG